MTLATQPSQKFEKEGILYVRERQEGFFRRTESKSLYFLLLFKIIGLHMIHVYVKFIS